MYAKLCKLLSDKCDLVVGKVPASASEAAVADAGEADAGASNKTNPFRIELLARCREFFAIKRSEKIAEIMQETSLTDADKEIKMVTMKRRYTGHIRFIGELFMLGIISNSVIVSCVEELLILAEVSSSLSLFASISSLLTSTSLGRRFGMSVQVVDHLRTKARIQAIEASSDGKQLADDPRLLVDLPDQPHPLHDVGSARIAR
jgi:hypothetical protein